MSTAKRPSYHVVVANTGKPARFTPRVNDSAGFVRISQRGFVARTVGGFVSAGKFFAWRSGKNAHLVNQ